MNLTISKGETLGLAGESDRDKSLPLIDQGPCGSLNLRMEIMPILNGPITIHWPASGDRVFNRRQELLDLIGLNASSRYKFPYDSSLVQWQRIIIVCALVGEPGLIVRDEAVSALDVSAQAQILNLVEDTQKQRQESFLFVAYGMAIVSHRVVVIYSGSIFELAPADTLFILSIIPTPRLCYLPFQFLVLWRKERAPFLSNPVNPPHDYCLCTRCGFSTKICR